MFLRSKLRNVAFIQGEAPSDRGKGEWERGLLSRILFFGGCNETERGGPSPIPEKEITAVVHCLRTWRHYEPGSAPGVYTGSKDAQPRSIECADNEAVDMVNSLVSASFFPLDRRLLMRVIEEAIAVFFFFAANASLLIEPFSGCLCSFCPFRSGEKFSGDELLSLLSSVISPRSGKSGL
ncbi:hypothetical protein VNO77_51124 [Canavalia gladiata]|uniref:Uncharacterized protein n=1 Tax=Canavalia gladiata TaxID=3824 RepID=A0AAN9JDW0_CANGL